MAGDFGPKQLLVERLMPKPRSTSEHLSNEKWIAKLEAPSNAPQIYGCTMCQFNNSKTKKSVMDIVHLIK